MSRVLLVNMPFGSLRWPHLGLSLLKAALNRDGVACDVAYLSFDLAEMVGVEHYHWVADQFAFVLGGEWLFAKHYFGERLPAETDYYREVLLPADPGLTGGDYQALVDTARHVEPFLEACLRAVDWSQYDIVGFTASFQQTMPSLCLAQRLKRLRPEITIALGGAACEGSMGPELLRQFPEIDYVFSGEADRTFPAFTRQGFHEEREDENGETGTARQCMGWESDPVRTWTSCPIPLSMTTLPASPAARFWRNRSPPGFRNLARLLVGEKCRCTFCGLNGDRLGFRSKTPDRTIDELRYLVDRYGIRRAQAADNILDPAFFQSLLPMLQDSRASTCRSASS